MTKMGDKTRQDKKDWSDTFNAICKLTFKFDRETFNKMGPMCIKQQQQVSVHSKQLNDAFSALGFDRGQQMILDYDSFVLL